MKNKTLKLILAGASLALFIAALGLFGASFIGTSVSGDYYGLATGFELAFKSVPSLNALTFNKSYNVGTLFAFIFVLFALLTACYAVLFVLFGKKSKKSKGNKNAKLLCALCTFVICALVPSVLLFLTKQTVVNSDVLNSSLSNYRLGVGSILSAVFCLLGGCALSLEEVL